MYLLIFLSFILSPILSNSSSEKRIAESKVFFEVINHQAENMDDIPLEIYQKDQLIAKFYTKKLTAISLPVEDYQFKVFYCDDTYTINTTLHKSRHHLVFVLDEKPCNEPLLLLK
ncbi:hypothetical protein MY04_3617 [Flammeovirga sp. MY04]|uniref:hypothetical protein n=1 Tax=Flammeovirga sp. MY04 TaxID=1191459 RepID=UPI0008064242|nr:hypothetical protein [Flammeovirga sp. MY04]ANQ50965.1 hypothetical protein MY04_3617 [Flammeovirga sp. MY04]